MGQLIRGTLRAVVADGENELARKQVKQCGDVVVNRVHQKLLCSCAVMIATSIVSTLPAQVSQTGRYDGNVLPARAKPAWSLISGRASESIVAGNWVVKSPSYFSRGIDLNPIAVRQDGQENVVEFRWSTTSQNNYSADGFHIFTQRRRLRLHPLYRKNGKSLLLTGTLVGMRPDLKNAIVDLSRIPEFDASRLNTYRVRWVTNKDDSYPFEVSINGKSVGRLPGELDPRSRRVRLRWEVRSGTHRVDYVRWQLGRGGRPIIPPPPRIARQPQLFFDDRLIDSQTGLKRTIHSPRMHSGNPVLKAEHPWEYGAVLLWGTVIYDKQDRLFKMWYMTWGNDAAGAIPGWRSPVCYATSSDGLKWRKPRLRLYRFQYRDVTQPGKPLRECAVNNIVYNESSSALGMDSPTVVKDTSDPDPQRRYKMCFWHRLPGGTGIYNAFSADGIHWKRAPKMVANTGDRNTFHYNPFQKKWTIVSRPAASFYELKRFGESNQNFIRTMVNIEQRDLVAYPDARLYSFPVINYAGMQIGFPELYSLKLNRWFTYLAWSRDGNDWHIDPARVKWMTWNRKPGTFDCWRRNIHNGGVIRRGKELWVYFSGRSQGKNVAGRAGYLVPSGKPGYDPRGIVGAIGLGIMRVDGFCSRDAGTHEATLTTKPFTFVGTRLSINANIKSGGRFRVAVLTDKGKSISGFALQQCRPLSGDRVSHLVTWRGSSLKALAGKTIRLRMSLKNTQLYSFHFE